MIFSTRILGPENFGIFAYSISLIGLLLAFFEFGISILSTKVISSKENTREEFIRYAFGLRLISYLVALMLLVFLYQTTSLLKHQLIVYTLFIYGISNSLTIFFRSVFRGYEVMKKEALSIIIDRTIVISLCCTVLFISPSLELFVVTYSIAFFASAAITFFFFKDQVINWLPSFDLKEINLRVIKPGSVFAVMNILLIARTNIPSLILENFSSSVQVGFFNSGYRLLTSYLLIPTVFVTPIYPIFVRLHNRKKLLSKLINNSSRLILAITSFLVLPFFFLKEEFTLFLYGQEYIDASHTIGILLFCMFAMGLTVIFGSLISASDHQKTANKAIAIEVILGIVIFFIGIKSSAANGAALAALIMECIMALVLIYVSRRLFEIDVLFKLVLKFLLVMAISYTTMLFVLDKLKFEIFLLDAFLATGILLLVHLIVGTISKEDFKRLSRIFYKLKERV